MATDMSYLSLETLTTFDLGGLTVSAGHPTPKSDLREGVYTVINM